MTTKAPAVVFLTETLTDEARLEYVKNRIQIDKKCVVERINRGGGLVLFWKNDLVVNAISSSLNQRILKQPGASPVSMANRKHIDGMNHGIYFVIYIAKIYWLRCALGTSIRS